jgi:hypothetical protein
MTDFLDALEQQLVGAAARACSAQPATPALAGAGAQAAVHRARPSRRRPRMAHRRWLPVLIPALLVLTAGGLALGGVIEVGAPAQPGYSASEAGLGALTIGSARLEPVSAPDPAGGPSWGMQVFSTRLGVGCLQVGRLVDGQLGALGEDGAFGDDGRFHEVPAGSSVTWFECSALDGEGRVFNNVTLDNLPVSGWNGFGGCAPETATAAEKAPERGHAIGICPESDERDLHFGLLGPEAQSVTYTSEGETRTLPTSGPDGAYLIVEHASPHQLLIGKGLGTSNVVPLDGPITEIHYRDGSTCHLTSKSWMGGNEACTPSLQMPVGFKPVKTPTAAEVSSPVSAQVATGAHGEQEVLVSFSSRVSITEYRSTYSLKLEESATDPRAIAPERSTPAEVKAGETVTMPVRALHFRESLPPGEYKGTVSLMSATGPELFEGPGTVFLPVGSFSVRVP